MFASLVGEGILGVGAGETFGPFADGPHLWLQQFTWDEDARTEIHVHWILVPGSATLRRYVQCHQAWRTADLVDLLARCGLESPEFHEPITGTWKPRPRM